MRLLEGLENFPLSRGQRVQEIGLVTDKLGVFPVVFIWGRSENGKTGFARELTESLPWRTQFVHPYEENSPRRPLVDSSSPYDVPVSVDTRVMIFDEFDVEIKNSQAQELIRDIERRVEGGGKFVFFLQFLRD